MTAPKDHGERLERLDHVVHVDDAVHAVKGGALVPLVHLVTRVLQESLVFLETVVHWDRPAHKEIVVPLVPPE